MQVLFEKNFGLLFTVNKTNCC